MRADYCPIGGEPCQSLCTEPCSVRKSVDSAVVAQLVDALTATKAWLDAEENHEFEPDFWNRANMARTAQNLVNAALAAAKEAGL